jgi:hypothetical protein
MKNCCCFSFYCLRSLSASVCMWACAVLVIVNLSDVKLQPLFFVVVRVVLFARLPVYRCCLGGSETALHASLLLNTPARTLIRSILSCLFDYICIFFVLHRTATVYSVCHSQSSALKKEPSEHIVRRSFQL